MGDLLTWVAAWSLLGVTVILSFGPAPPGAGLVPFGDKAFHLASSGATVFAFLLAAVWRPGRRDGRFPGAAGWIVLAALALAATVEVLQGAAFGRDAELLDWAADAAGTAAAWLLWARIRARTS